MNNPTRIQGQVVSVSGKLLRFASLRDEYYEFLPEPRALQRDLEATAGVRADLFTFVQEVPDNQPRYDYYQEWDHVALLPVSTYEHWWKKQINDKTRNMIRKCQKGGVEFRQVPFDDALVRGIHRIYNESPVRQGRPFRHFGKDVPAIGAEHATFLDRSTFVGAYLGGELIGFIKLVQGRGVANLMNIISLTAHRDKSPTNGLIAQAVELCAQRSIPRLVYGSWSRRSMGDFKKHHAFESVAVPRYYLPTSTWGRLALKLGLHRPFEERIPERWADRLVALRAGWNLRRLQRRQQPRPTPPLALAPVPTSSHLPVALASTGSVPPATSSTASPSPVGSLGSDTSSV